MTAMLTRKIDAICAEGHADLRASISIPVVRGKGYVIRSSPGEPPRYDAGDLYKGVLREPAAPISDREVIAYIYVDPSQQAKAGWLENGTKDGRMAARPWWGPWLSRFRGMLERMKS